MSMEQSQIYAHSPTGAQPPRHLEPRPALHTSLSEPSGQSRPPDTYRYRGGSTREHRSQSQNLPGVKDILNPQPYPPSHTSYDTTWNSYGAPPRNYTESERCRILNGVHPPMVLHPPTSANQGYHPQLDKPYEVSGIETNRPSQAPPISPYGGFPNGARDYSEAHAERPKLVTTGPMLSNGVPNSHHNTVHDEPQYRIQAAPSYRQGRSGLTVAGAEPHGKYLGVQDIVGEGKFHIYEDGYRIPTQVDGEQVNPAWGLTKANKPRKRLALACLDCREKKIKCEPRTNGCVQCEKAMRPCRKAPEKYSQTEPASNYYVGSPVRKSRSGSDTTPTSNHNREPDSSQKRRSRADPSPPLEANKRPRSISPRSDHSQDAERLREEMSPSGIAGSSATAAAREESLMWENDPFAVEPDVTIYLLDLYFAHLNKPTYCMFPRKHFLNWLKSYSHKCQNERLVLYAMLAAASIYAEEQLAGFGKQCAQIVGDALYSELGRFNIAAAQSKMLLAIYQFAKGSNGLAWDLVGSAIRTVTYMNLNTEEGCQDDEESRGQSRFEFAFSPEQLAECKRRTFWSCFLQDRYIGPTMCTIKPQDIFVRLPSTEDVYERSGASNAPYFPNDIIGSGDLAVSSTDPVAPVAWLIMVAAIWGDVTDFAFRASHRPNSTYRDYYETFYSQTLKRAQDWLKCVPEHLQYTETNLDNSIQLGYVGTFVSMHVLYHLSLIKLNRYMRHAVIPDSVSRNIRTANHHGHQILQIMTALHAARRDVLSPVEGQPNICAFTSQFPGYAIISAIDIVSAGGLDSNLKATLDEIDGALGCLRELSQYWRSSKEQLRVCEKRFYQLKNITITPKTAKSGCWIGRKWGIKAPLEPEFASEDDCIYGLGVLEADETMEKYFDAFKER